MKCSKNLPLGFSFYCLVIKLSTFKQRRTAEAFPMLYPNVITPPARRARRSYKFAPFLFFFFPVSKVGAPLMGDTAVHSLSHDFKLNF